ncbi:MAG: hypothetical protein H6718_36685 [Polyangiaceae bacterium]|nr:hypothetical protein [Myxococcales bacterium]MCB9591000.1 hypothetical protein [Polyangiaceae bacterium]
MGTQPPLSVATRNYGLELVKLFLQVVWADHEVTETETARLKQYAQNLGLHPEHIAELDTYLRGEAPLPPPNLALLKDHRVEVLKSVRRLLQELNIGEDETEILGELSAMLGASSFPPAR